ncbi:MAG TPA: type II toxin-antitoxin system PemK/MazF family toxin [Clostridia bacterium]|nr:type II toxin-antitoxin system PemK/MazF family toxin [Clostridia bacterium]
MRVVIRRGDLFMVKLGLDSRDREISRPVLVIQNDIGNRFCNSIIVVPLSHTLRAKRLFFAVLINRSGQNGLQKDHVALFSQIRTLDKTCFSNDNYLGRLSPEIMQKVDTAIELSLGLSTLQKLQNRSYLQKQTS